MAKVDDSALTIMFQGPFRQRLDGDWAVWRDGYTQFVDRVRTADDDEWMTPSFQKLLWDQNPIADVGLGRLVVIDGAYADTALARSLLQARDAGLAGNAGERGEALQAVFESVLAAVQPHNNKRPLARAMRLLAALFPVDMCCLADERRLWHVAATLDVLPAKPGALRLHPLIRERLRALLGPADSPAGQVEQSMFTWFLWQHLCKKPDAGAVAVGGTVEVGGDGVATSVRSLSLLPASVQRKGLVQVNDNVRLLVSIVREAEQGLSRADLINVILQEAPTLKSAGSASNIIAQAQGGLGLIRLADNAYRPTDLGLELLSAPDAATVLQPLLVGRVFGIGHLLLALRDQPDGIGRKALGEQLSKRFPTHTSLRPSSELISWGVSSKLAVIENGQIRLTEDGAAYADALPPDFLEVWALEPIVVVDGPEDDDPPGDPPVSKAFQPASWAALKQKFDASAAASRLIMPDGFLAELHAALHASSRKRFVLLAGLSGTGKTSVARAYAEAYCAALGLQDFERRYALVAVRPDWTDPTGLLGYVNAVAEPPSFQAGEGLNLLLDADQDTRHPYFLCLDEMNLARVEHYFAPFLSAMEGEAATLALHGEAEAVGNVQPCIAWPANLFIFGTVNMDESTHPFSDKVLDRAFTFEFSDVDLAQWRTRKLSAGSNPATLDPVSACLQQLYTALVPARRQFGYRTADEVLAFCEAGLDALPLMRLLDAAVLAKVLPHMRGDDSGPLKAALAAMAEALPAAAFPRSSRKLHGMEAALAATGQARFWA